MNQGVTFTAPWGTSLRVMTGLSVVLSFDARVVVVTPENPQGFVSKIRELKNL